MRVLSFYFILTLVAYLCQTVLYPLLLIPELRVDLFLILIIHCSFANGMPWTLLLAFLVGLFMDTGSPLGGFFHPLFYMAVAFATCVLCQNFYLDSRRYQAIFLGLCTLAAGGGIWLVVKVQGGQLPEVGCLLRLLGWRTMVTCLLGPVLLAGMERLYRWLGLTIKVPKCQEG